MPWSFTVLPRLALNKLRGIVPPKIPQMNGAYRNMPIHHHTWLLLKSLNVEQLCSIYLPTWNLQLSIHNHLKPILKILGHASLHAIWVQHSILHIQKLMALLFRDIHHRLSILKKNHYKDKQAPCSQRMNPAAKTFPTMIFKGFISFFLFENSSWNVHQNLCIVQYGSI